MSTHPRRRPDIIAEQIGDETMLIAAAGDALHVLNPTARVIWDLLDGTHDAAALAAALRARYSIGPEHNVEADVSATLAALRAKGLLAAD